MQLSSNIPCIW